MLKLVLLLSIFSFVYLNPIVFEKDPLTLAGKFEGDIDLDDLDGDGKLTKNDINQNSKTFADRTSSLWPSGIVPYIIDSTYTSSQRDTILSGMKLIQDQTKVDGLECIKFVPRTSQSAYIRVSDTGNGCYSKIGKQTSSGAQQVSLSTSGCIYMGIAAHEFIHALGFWHEQSRPDRDKYIRVNYENIQSGMEFNFEKQTTQSDTLGLPYDLASLMHYESYSFSKNGLPTIEALSGYQFSSHSKFTSLSKNDIAAIKKLYGCSATNTFLDYKLFFLLLLFSFFYNGFSF